MPSEWKYRLVKRKDELRGREFIQLCQVYCTGDKIRFISDELPLRGTVEDIKTSMQAMIEAMSLPIVEEVRSLQVC